MRFTIDQMKRWETHFLHPITGSMFDSTASKYITAALCNFDVSSDGCVTCNPFNFRRKTKIRVWIVRYR